MQNAYVESFNGRLRDECLNANWFTSLGDARRKVETWRQDYNRTTSTQFVKLLAARRVCTDRNGDASMRKASKRLPEQGLKSRPLLRTSSPLDPKINRELTLGLVQQTGAFICTGIVCLLLEER